MAGHRGREGNGCLVLHGNQGPSPRQVQVSAPNNNSKTTSTQTNENVSVENRHEICRFPGFLITNIRFTISPKEVGI